MAKTATAPSQQVPLGLCQCGCGRTTRIAPQSVTARGWVRGEPIPFARGHKPRKSLVEYIVDAETGCWEWQLAMGGKKDGYGHKWDPEKRRVVRAHITYYEREHGPVPEGLEIDHLCRNRACVNPSHLEAVSHIVNVRRGATTKLTVEQVAEIRASSDSPNTLARRYGVSRWNVRTILTNPDRWRAE